MEYILGTTLRRVIKTGTLQPKAAVKFARQTAQALKAAHAIADEWTRTKVLATLAPQLSRPQLQHALTRHMLMLKDQTLRGHPKIT